MPFDGQLGQATLTAGVSAPESGSTHPTVSRPVVVEREIDQFGGHRVPSRLPDLLRDLSDGAVGATFRHAHLFDRLRALVGGRALRGPGQVKRYFATSGGILDFELDAAALCCKKRPQLK
jgi:hypothetical protein